MELKNKKPVRRKKKVESININYVNTNEDKFIKNDPIYAHNGDCGLDVRSISLSYDSDNDCYIYGTGIKCESEEGIGAFAMARSSVYSKGSSLSNGVGLIDTAVYKGEIMFIFYNRIPLNVRSLCDAIKIYHLKMNWVQRLFTSFSSTWKKTINSYYTDPLKYAPYKIGDKIGQLVFIKTPKVSLNKACSLSDSERGEGGFGSTGE